MDVSYTNVLEGARQYFQGLPAASSSTGSPATAQIQQQPRENDGSVHSEQHSAVPYWGDHQNEGQGTNLPNRDVMNPPQPSRPVQQTNPPPTSSANYHYEKPQPSSYTTNYPHIYQPHIPSNRSYHYEIPPQPPKTSYANTSQPHQTQQSSSNNITTYTYQAHTNQYPSYAQNSTSSSSQAQEMHYNYKQQYTNSQQQASRSYPTNYYPPQQHQPQQRVTHQLPVVPTDTYHSRPNSKPIQPTIKSNYRPAPQTFQRLPLQNGGGASTSTSIPTVIPSTSYNDQYKYYQNTPKYTSYTNTSTTTTTTYSQYINPAQNYIDTRVNNLQQRPQIPKFTETKPVQKVKQKRESPLDLSVKTVKTTADSTRNVDYDDRNNYRNNIQQSRYEMYPTTARAPKVDFLPNFQMPNNPPKDIPPNKNYYNYALPTSNPPREPLPRIDFPAIEQRQKRPMDHPLPAAIPEKIPKVDIWRQNMDKQIEQRLSSYSKSRLEQEQKQLVQPVNGNISHPITQLPQKNINPYNETHQKFPNNTVHSNNNNNTYQYPPYPQYNPNYNYQIQKIPQPMPKPPNKQTANKSVLNLLRNTIHTKGAKKIEHDKLLRQTYREIITQQPSTDVMAPLQPKPGIIGRRNVSPFTAASLERNSNTPPAYKLHIPKAIDSVIFSDTEKDQQDQQASMGGSQSDLDGLAAFLAARIRTKAELKQVGPSEQTSNNNVFGVITTTSPPKEPSAMVTPKKLFNRDNRRADVSIRSSSETSVFDFPDSDNETEMPVLDRQSLVGMRKDRKTVPNQFTGKEECEEERRPVSPFSMMFNTTCDTFMEQLKNGCGKKRGRRKKLDTEESNEAILVIKKEPEDAVIPSAVEEITIKQEPIDEEVVVGVKDKSDSDSDTPLIICKTKLLSKVKDENVVEDKTVIISSDSEVDVTKKSINKISLLDLKNKTLLAKPAKKPAFGDGSDFHPGWEEELYKYKKSLRMPRMLIQVTRPPNCQRLSTSLPDLDPCPVSPAQSSIADGKFKLENIDSDMDSNCSFNFSLTKTNYDSEEGGSVKSLQISKYSSILDRLIERYGAKKRKRLKKIDDTPKIIPKSENPLELLPTPTVDDRKIPGSPVKTGLNFRKKTVENFKDAFMNNSVGASEFATVVLKSRTRTETRVLKEKATIREVFGEDRPASAPPVTCLDELKPDDMCEKQQGKENKSNKLLNENFLKVLEKVQIKAEADIKKEDDVKVEDGVNNKKRSKLRSIRRKFSSGFDYIRKKKKIVKKEDAESEVKVKSKKRWSVPKACPESVQDIQKEIKMWVLNKGVGETHLHRAARSGFIDIAAYCLEKMACNPSPKDNAGYTPLHEACSKGHLVIAELLLQYGAHVSESAQGGIRPLHEAAENGYVEIVRLLLAYGADPMLATYSGITPLQLAVDETTVALLEQHLDELQGKCNIPWNFSGPSDCFDPIECGYNPFSDIPEPDSPPVEEEMDFEISEVLLPNLYILPGCADTDRWVLLQELSNILKIKSKETLLRQLNAASTSNVNKSDIVRELKTADFLEQAKCCQFLNGNEKLNTRASKIFLVKYSEKVKELLNVESEIISAS